MYVGEEKQEGTLCEEENSEERGPTVGERVWFACVIMIVIAIIAGIYSALRLI